MTDNAGQINGCFNAGVAAADDGHALTFEQWAIAVWAVGHALTAVLLLAGYIQFAPAGPRRDDDALGLERCTTRGANLGITTGFRGRAQRCGTLQIHDVHVVGFDVLLQLGDQLGPFGFLNGDEVFNADGIHDLATEALGQNAGPNAFAGRVDGRGRASRATTDDEHIVGRLGADLFGFAGSGTRIEFGENFFDGHATGTEFFTIHIDGGYGHDLT